MEIIFEEKYFIFSSLQRSLENKFLFEIPQKETCNLAPNLKREKMRKILKNFVHEKKQHLCYALKGE